MPRILVVVFLFLLANCGAKAQSKSLISFNSLSTSGNVQVELVKGDSPSAEYKILKGNEDDLYIEVKNGELEVKIKPKNSKWNRSETKAKVTVYYQTITEIDCSAGSSVSTNSEIEATNMDVDASSGSNCAIKLKSDKVEVSASSGAKVSLNGSCTSVKYDASSGANIDGAYLLSSNANADVSSGASILLHASNKLSAEASSGGSIKYKGKPSSTKIDSGRSGSVKEF